MPRLGLATIDISALGGSGDTVTTIDDFVFESFSAGQMHPMLTTSRTNLVRNSNFTTDSIWSKTNATINTTTNKGTITVTSGGFSALSQGVTFEVGKTYTVSAVVNGEAGKEMRFQDNGNNTGGLTTSNATITMTGSDQNVEITWVANSNSTEFVIARNTASGNYSFDISKVQVEQDGFASAFIPTSGSTVTVPTTLNDTSEVWDFDGTDIMIAEDPEDEGFWEEGSNLVLNHSYEELGSELVSSGTFSSFSKDFGDVTISGDTVSFVNTGSNANSRVSLGSSSVAANKRYEIVFDVSRYVVGQLQIILGGTSHTVNISAGVNTYTVYLLSGSIDTDVRFKRSGGVGDFDFDLDNVSVKQVDPNDRWNPQTGWSISDGKAHVDTSSTVFIAQSFTNLGAGNTYEVTFTISNFTAGVLQPQFGGILSSPVQINSNGTHTVKITATSSSHSLLLYAIGTSKFSIDNVTIKEYAIKPKDI